MPYFDTSRATLYYDLLEPDETGASSEEQRRTVLLLHGFMGTPKSEFAGQLAVLGSRYRVLAPHLYGYGQSSQRSEYQISYYRDDAADMVALLDRLAIEKVLVLGFSDGGIAGLLLAALYPTRVEALAVLGAQPAINAEDGAAIRYWLLERPLSEEWQAQLADLHGEPYWRSLPAMYVRAQEDLVRAGGVLISDEELAAISCPTLVMHGVRDRVVPVSYAHTITEKISGSELLLFDAGHAAHLRCEQDYTEAVTRFFTSVQ